MKNILILLCVFSFFTGKATHMAGGEISYTHLSGLTYKVKVKVYRDCAGIPAPQSALIYSNSLTLGVNQSDVLPFLDSSTYSSFCPNVLTTCNGGILPGYQIWIYEGNVTLPAQAADWTFSFENCCRNGAIMNLSNPNTDYFGLISTLNNSANAIWNNSAQFMLEHGLVYNSNQTYVLNQTAIDIDGDSLDYQLVDPINTINNGIATYCNFEPPFTAANPLAGTLNINNMNGNMTFNSSVQGKFVVAIKVSEYRSGVLVGSVLRDLQLVFVMSNANFLPTLSGVNGSPNYSVIYPVCAGNSLSFTVDALDADALDTLLVAMDINNIPGATLSSNNAAQPVITFNWTPTAADVRPQPYLLGLQVKDNHCDLNGVQNFGYLIYLTQCNTDTVWPGDANSDFTVNNYDVLNIGIANNTTGIVRPGATTNWNAQYCMPWANNFINNINYKHADCDGNGTVDNTDLNAITLNYGQFHLKKENIGKYKTRGLPDLFFDTNGLQAIPGTTLQIPVHLGSQASPMNNMYGIAGKMLVSNTLSNNIAVSNTMSWLGTNANSFLFQKNIGGYNAADFTLVRNNQLEANGYGQIATLSVPIDANAIIGSDLVLQFANLKLIDLTGNEITDYNALSDTLKIAWPLGNSAIEDIKNNIAVYPNPVSDQLSIEINNTQNLLYEVIICDMTGKVMYADNLANGVNSINTSSFSKGIYFVKISNNAKESVTYKISK